LLNALEPAEREAAFMKPSFIDFVERAPLHDGVKRWVLKTLRKRKTEVIDSDTLVHSAQVGRS